jgi:hypothetical protein
MSRLKWGPILQHAASIVRSYSTGVTLRQLFYRLVSDGTLPNTNSAYTSLSKQTAKARRDGWFPDLIDRGRIIHRHETFSSPAKARNWLKQFYRQGLGIVRVCLNGWDDVGRPPRAPPCRSHPGRGCPRSMDAGQLPAFSSSCRMTCMACDHSSGVAVAPQRSRQ